MIETMTHHATTKRNLLLGCLTLAGLVLLPLAFEREATAALNEAQKTERALQFITQHGTAMAKIMGSESMPKQEKRLKLKVILEENLDLNIMTRAIVGAYWRKMTELQRERYKEAATQWVLLYSANFLSTLKPSQLDVLEAKHLGKDVLVGVDLLSKSDPEPLTVHWRVRFNPNDEATVIDLHFAGLSVIGAQRFEASSILAEQGIPIFLDKLDERVKKIKQDFNKN